MVDTFQVPALPRMFCSIRMLFLLHHPGDRLLPKLCSVWSNFEKSLSCMTYMLYSNYFPGSFLGKNPSFPLRSPPFPLHPGQCLVVMGCHLPPHPVGPIGWHLLGAARHLLSPSHPWDLLPYDPIYLGYLSHGLTLASGLGGRTQDFSFRNSREVWNWLGGDREMVCLASSYEVCGEIEEWKLELWKWPQRRQATIRG